MSITVFYTPRMVADSQSYSPSARKPEQVVQSWLQLGLPLRLVEPEPVTRDQLCLAHSDVYVDGVLSTQKPNGFGNRSAQVAESLPYTSGAMLAAARCALDNGFGAVAPCSGFHHAGHGFGGGFCTFNGLMVTACTLLKEARVQRIAILDLDMHFGNGTVDIIDHLGLNDCIAHHSAAPHASRADAWLSQLSATVQQLCQGCDLLLYQAGADSHIDDPLGGYLSTEAMRLRDDTVFKAARNGGVPVAWNLAGGYQRLSDGSIRPVLDLHDNTLKAFAQCFADVLI